MTPRRRCTRAGSSTPDSACRSRRRATSTPSPLLRATVRRGRSRGSASGDRTCRANQALHPEAVNEVAEVSANRYYVPSFANPLNPDTFVHKIHVPVFLACQWTDEQTGGHCPELAEHFTGTRLKWFTFTNGAHIDSLDPATAVRWYDFLSLFVAQRMPDLTSELAGARAAAVPGPQWGSAGSRSGRGPDRERARLRLRAGGVRGAPAIRILFDNGSGGSTPGSAGGRVRAVVCAASRCPGTLASSWYLGAGGTLGAAAPGVRRRRHVQLGSAGPARYRLHREHRPGGLWGATPQLSLDPESARDGAVIPDCAAVLRTWWRSGRGRFTPGSRRRRRDVDLQVTVSEVRPDGYGDIRPERVARASERKPRSRREHAARAGAELRRADARPLPRGTVHRGGRAALLRGSRVPGGLADPDHDLCPGRRSADMGVLRSRCRVSVGGRRCGWPIRRRCRRGSSCRWCRALRCPPACRRARGCAASRAGATSRWSTGRSAEATLRSNPRGLFEQALEDAARRRTRRWPR